MTLSYPKHLLALMARLQKLPGVGRKTAERFAFHLLTWDTDDLHTFGTLIDTLPDKVGHCDECGSLVNERLACPFCRGVGRNRNALCVIASPRDVYAVEATGMFSGLYHVLGALLSPLEGNSPEEVDIPALLRRVDSLRIKEIIVALDSTLEGDATALLIKEALKDRPVGISKPALGLPLGSSLDFVDEGTLSQALSGRQPFR